MTRLMYLLLLCFPIVGWSQITVQENNRKARNMQLSDDFAWN